MKKSTLVRQRDISDCGPACLVSVAAYFGLTVPVSQVRAYSGTDQKGTPLRGLMQAACRLNLHSRSVRVKNRDLTNIPVPTICHLNLPKGLQHFVVFYGIKKKRICLMDPALGKRVYLRFQEFETIWSGVILLLMPAKNFRPAGKKESVYYQFWRLLKPHQNKMFGTLACAGLYMLFGLSLSWYVQKIFDFGLIAGNKSRVNRLSILMMILLVFRMVWGYLKSLLSLKTGQQIDIGLIRDYYQQLLKLPQLFLDNMRVGEFVSRFNDAIRIRVFINDLSLHFFISLITLLGCLTLTFIYSWEMALILLSSIPLYGLIYRISNRVNTKWQRRMMESGAALESHLIESIRGVKTIRRFGAEERFRFLMENKLFSLMKAMYAGSRYGIQLSQITEGMTGLVTILVVWSGSGLVIGRHLSAGELLLCFTLMAFFGGPVQCLVSANRSLQDALIAADRLFEITNHKTEKEVRSALGEVLAGDLVFQHVHFRYGTGNPVFSGLELRFNQNQITGLIGPSGSGKSTILSMAQGLYPPDSGQVLLGNTDIRDIPLELLRKHIVAVPQQIDLFQGDFLLNIALHEPQPRLERIYEICQRLGLDEFIHQLADGYGSVIREEGLNLSGGQKQKIGLARALYADPSVLILDEATAALDSRSAKKVRDTIQWFHGLGKTIILITHNLSFLQDCDSVIRLDKGKASLLTGHPLFSGERQVSEDWGLNFT